MNDPREQQIKEQEELDLLADEAGLATDINENEVENRYVGTVQQFEKFEELQANNN